MSDPKLKEKVKQQLAAIKKLLFADAGATVPGTLADGTAVLIMPSLEVGGMIHSVDPATAGPGSVLPDGSYTMDDGTTVTIVDGKISEVGTPAGDNTGDMMPMMQKMAEMLAEFKTALAATETKLTAIEKENGELKTKLEALGTEKTAAEVKAKADKEAETKFRTEVFSILKTITDAPATSPVTKPQTFQADKKDPVKARVDRLVEMHLATIQKNQN